MKKYLIVASIFGVLAIILGAFGAHALKSSLSDASLTSFETGVRYQMYHAIVLLFVNSYSKFSLQQIQKMSRLFVLGILFFSGSIYAITFGVPASYIWFITPLGGLFFITGWTLMLFSFIKNN